MRHAECLWQAWRRLAPHGCVPAKASFEPETIKPILPDVVLYERLTAASYRIRLIGTRVVERIGVDATGSNALSLMSDRGRTIAAEALARVLDRPCGHLSLVEDRYPSGFASKVEILRLPLGDDCGRPRYVISATEAIGQTAWHDKTDKPALLANPLKSVFFDLRTEALPNLVADD